MYSRPFPSKLMTVLRRIHVRNAKLLLKSRNCFVELENHECMKMVMENIAKVFPAYLMNPANRETFHPRNLSFTVYELYLLTWAELSTRYVRVSLHHVSFLSHFTEWNVKPCLCLIWLINFMIVKSDSLHYVLCLIQRWPICKILSVESSFVGSAKLIFKVAVYCSLHVWNQSYGLG